MCQSVAITSRSVRWSFWALHICLSLFFYLFLNSSSFLPFSVHTYVSTAVWMTNKLMIKTLVTSFEGSYRLFTCLQLAITCMFDLNIQYALEVIKYYTVDMKLLPNCNLKKSQYNRNVPHGVAAEALYFDCIMTLLTLIGSHQWRSFWPKSSWELQKETRSGQLCTHIKSKHNPEELFRSRQIFILLSPSPLSLFSLFSFLFPSLPSVLRLLHVTSVMSHVIPATYSTNLSAVFFHCCWHLQFTPTRTITPPFCPNPCKLDRITHKTQLCLLP